MSKIPQPSPAQSPDRPVPAEAQTEPARRKGLSMHEDVPVWYDCCSCEAEPYWVEALGEPPAGEASDESGE
jgi:hypothetical protein